MTILNQRKSKFLSAWSILPVSTCRQILPSVPLCSDITCPRPTPSHPDLEALTRQALIALAGKSLLISNCKKRLSGIVNRSGGKKAGTADAEKSCRPLEQLLYILKTGTADNIRTKQYNRKAVERNELQKLVLKMKVKLGCLKKLFQGQATKDDHKVSSFKPFLIMNFSTL